MEVCYFSEHCSSVAWGAENSKNQKLPRYACYHLCSPALSTFSKKDKVWQNRKKVEKTFAGKNAKTRMVPKLSGMSDSFFLSFPCTGVNVAVLGAHQAQRSAKLAMEGDFSRARSEVLGQQRLVSNFWYGVFCLKLSFFFFFNLALLSEMKYSHADLEERMKAHLGSKGFLSIPIIDFGREVIGNVSETFCSFWSTVPQALPHI